MIFDAVIAFWFLAGAPSIVGLGSDQQGSATRNTRKVDIITGR
jgi:hypothetical protein